MQQDSGNTSRHQVDNPSDELRLAKQEATQAQESLKVMEGFQNVSHGFTGKAN